MKYLGSLLLYSISLIIPIGLINLIFEGTFFYVLSVTYALAWLAVYLNIHKVILLLLDAREVIDADQQKLFQNIKASSYKTYTKAPKVYLYSGSYKNCFVLDSETEWSIVLDKTLLAELDPEAQMNLVEYFYKVKKINNTYFATKALGICVLFYSSFFWFLQNIFLLNPNSKGFRVLAFFTIFITKPVLIPIEKLIGRMNLVEARVGLKPFYYQLRPKDTYTIFTKSLLGSDLKVKKMLIDYMEAYPILSRCEFVNEH